MVTFTRQTKGKNIAAITMFLAALLLITGSAGALWASTKGFSRSDSQGPVMVTATYLPTDKTTDEIRVEVRLNTHSVDLGQYKLEDLAFLRFDGGKEIKALGITQQGSGHHVTDVLRFAGPVPKGAGEMTLIIRNVGGIAQRSLTWKLPVE